MKKQWILYLLPLLTAFAPSAEQTRWVVQKGSTVSVKGKTNVNSYGCGITSYDGCDTIVMMPHPTSPKSLLLNGCIYLDVARFDCFNRIMTSELRKTLNAAQHPKLKIKFITLDKISGSQSDNNCGVVEIELAGIRKRYAINYCYTTGSNGNTLILTGKKTLNFSDFCLKPPRKLNGMVQARDELDIAFSLVMRRA